MTIRLIENGSEPSVDLEVAGIPRSGDYIRSTPDSRGQYIVLFASYTVGQDAVDIHVARTTETEVQYAARLAGR